MYGFKGTPQPVGGHFSELRTDSWEEKYGDGFTVELRNLGIDPAAGQDDLWEIYDYAKANLAGKTQQPVNPEFREVLKVLDKYYDSWN